MAGEASGLGARLKGLAEAVRLSTGRADEAVLSEASDVVRRAGERLSIAGDHTVVALAGATGSGKSSLLNALTGTQLARVGVTRPTTSQTLGVAWGSELPTELLDWLDVPRRHLIAASESALSDLVLLDLPDHDSTETTHKLAVDRLVKLVDMLVWVVDPQKYADAALHDGYLRPLAQHAEVMVIVLNQVDRLTADQRHQAVADLRRLLDSEGLGASLVLEASAHTGEGVGELKQLLARTVSGKQMMAARVLADVGRSGNALAADLGTGPVPNPGKHVVAQLTEATAEAAGVPIVVDGVARAWRRRGVAATGWPMVSWVQRLRPDPLRLLHLGAERRGRAPTEVSRTSLPKASAVQRARLDTALRDLTDAATEGIPRGWAEQVKLAVRGQEARLADRLDGAVAATDLRLDRGHGWWVLVTILQWVLFAALIVGGVWLLLPLLLALAQAPTPLPTVTVPWAPFEGWPVQVVLFGGGIVGGIALHLLSRIGVEIGARVKARQAGQALSVAIGEVVEADVVEPVRVELARLAAAREAAATASGLSTGRQRR